MKHRYITFPVNEDAMETLERIAKNTKIKPTRLAKMAFDTIFGNERYVYMHPDKEVPILLSRNISIDNVEWLDKIRE